MKKQTWQQWARAAERDPESPSNLRKGSLAPLTGTDCRALDAFVACIELYASTGDPRVLEATCLVLGQMQEKTRWIARELIPFVMDWSDRERLWPRIVGSADEEPDAILAPTHYSNCGADWDER